MICDKFGAKLKHGNKGNMLVFDRNYLVKIGKAYDRSEGIQTRLLDLVESKTKPCPSAPEKSEIGKSDSCDLSDSISGMRHSNHQIESCNNYENDPSCVEKLDDLSHKLDANKECTDSTDSTYLQEESPESLESPVTKDLEFPFLVTSTGMKIYKCPFHIEGCRVQNIHPEEIECHIKYRNSQDGSQNSNFSYRHNTMYMQTILLNLVIPRTMIT